MVAEACGIDIVLETVAMSQLADVEGPKERDSMDPGLVGVSNEKQNRNVVTFRDRAWMFFKLYFLEGQTIDEKHKIIKDDPNIKYSWVQRHRHFLALAIPFVCVHTIWWSLMITQDWFYLFNEPFGDFGKPRFWIAVTMIFGSMVGGATAEGGGGKFAVIMLFSCIFYHYLHTFLCYSCCFSRYDVSPWYRSHCCERLFLDDPECGYDICVIRYSLHESQN